MQSSHPGILIEATNEILQPTDYQAEYLTTNWARSIKKVRHGLVDGLISAYRSDAPDLIFTQQPFMLSHTCFFVDNSSDWQYRSIKDLHSRNIAFMNGYSYGPAINQYIANNELTGQRNLVRISGLNAESRRLMLLEIGRVDTILEDNRVFAYILKDAKLPPRFKQAGCLEGQNLHIGFSPKIEKANLLADMISDGIMRLKRSGRLQQLIDKYVE